VTGSDREYENLLQFLYACPVGIAETSRDGTIQMLNAFGAQMLARVCSGSENLFAALSSPQTSFRSAVTAFTGSHGSVCSGLRVAVPTAMGVIHIEVTLWKVDDERYMVVFADASAAVAAEQAQREELQREAERERLAQHARLEFSATILHDIGNAITGMGTRLAHLIAEPSWPEHQSLVRLTGLLEANAAALEASFPGKSRAILEMMRALGVANQERHKGWQDSLSLFARGVAHVREILSLHRRLVPDGRLGERAAVDFRNVLDDALMFLERSFAKRSIRLTQEIAQALRKVSGDRTRLTQVAMNLLKNACESFDQLPPSDSRARLVTVRLLCDQADVVLSISDNGVGFDKEFESQLFHRGATTKASGSGVGLASSLAVARSHGGTLELNSEGPGTGATAILRIPAE
jgi:signal transduction histidine kinase